MGLLGDSFDDPRTLATFNLAAGLLGGGNIGQAAMRGLAGYQGSMQSAADLAQKQQALEIQNIALQQAIRKFNLTMPLYEQAARYFGGGAPQAASAAPAAAVPTTGATTASGGSSPGVPSAAPAGAPQAAPQSATQVAPQPASTLYPNVPDNVALTTLMSGDLGKLADVVAKYNEPTEFAKTLAAAGIPQGSPLYHQLMQDSIAKSNYIAPTPLRSPQYIDPKTGQVKQVPMAIEGSMWQQDPTSPTGYSYVQTPGATESIRAVEKAKEAGKGDVIPFAGFDLNGPAPITSRTEAATRGTRGGAASTPPPAASPLAAAIADANATAGGNAQYNIGGQTGTITNGVARPGTLYGAPPFGVQTTAEEMAKGAAKQFVDLPAQVTQSKMAVQGLENALEALKQTTSGPGSKGAFSLMGYLNTAHIPLLPGDTTGYQTLSKFLNNAATQASIANGSNGSDARFEQQMAGMPNAETMNPPALEKAIRYVLSQQDAAVARGTTLPGMAANYAGDPNAQAKALNDWAKVYNPRWFEIQRMAPQDQQQAVSQMSKADAFKFLAWRKKMGYSQ